MNYKIKIVKKYYQYNSIKVQINHFIIKKQTILILEKALLNVIYIIILLVNPILLYFYKYNTSKIIFVDLKL